MSQLAVGDDSAPAFIDQSDDDPDTLLVLVDALFEDFPNLGLVRIVRFRHACTQNEGGDG